MIVNLSMVSKKIALPRHFASTIRPCCPSIDRDMCCPFIAAELMKAFASADLQSELNSSQDKQKVYPPVLKHGWENVRKNGKSSTNNFQWEDLSIAMFEYQRVDLTW